MRTRHFRHRSDN